MSRKSWTDWEWVACQQEHACCCWLVPREISKWSTLKMVSRRVFGGQRDETASWTRCPCKLICLHGKGRH